MLWTVAWTCSVGEAEVGTIRRLLLAPSELMASPGCNLNLSSSRTVDSAAYLARPDRLPFAIQALARVRPTDGARWREERELVLRIDYSPRGGGQGGEAGGCGW
jgi:hypothetical protein